MRRLKFASKYLLHQMAWSTTWNSRTLSSEHLPAFLTGAFPCGSDDLTGVWRTILWALNWFRPPRPVFVVRLWAVQRTYENIHQCLFQQRSMSTLRSKMWRQKEKTVVLTDTWLLHGLMGVCGRHHRHAADDQLLSYHWLDDVRADKASYEQFNRWHGDF